ncbi:F-box protein SKIP19-like [Cynara cardunculus var. scolymus]|uniref:F-box protein SKIP19-like n=1 Tax=Cynara cardunculus var. scolymus TaxID=59895 RepID=UPI000D630B28|nr:F-box protein SKIP19-like [Cynara cardunculus var. scolymus]XP_024971854.1 F-box protein SKIP19-like [Cynara cardunculus var. scolymus]XP_024971855.1 F-box protein SKIP19-like [Cynara cardunculus var. scolymus]XP_024971856.1 F-box protein SKIP19-like [Cynara cardunculus var. scolymus]
MMPSTSKSNRRKPKKVKFIPKPKQRWQVKQPRRNWLELPSDVMANILSRVHVVDILENAQKVCTTWRKICNDPSMWRVICMDYWYKNEMSKDLAMCKHAVDRSQGQLIDITIGSFGDDEILQYVADRSSQLRRLKIVCYYGYTDPYRSWTETLKKFPLLEELSLYSREISKEAIETAGRYCPMLKTFKLNERTFYEGLEDTCNKIAIAIGENLHKLEHLELIGNSLTNIGLQVILDGCPHLKSLDLRKCWSLDLKGDLGKRCSEKIKCLKLPGHSLEGSPYMYGNDDLDDSDFHDDDDYDHEYDGYLDYEDYTDYDDFSAFNYDGNTRVEELNEMLTFMDMFE